MPRNWMATIRHALPSPTVLVLLLAVLLNVLLTREVLRLRLALDNEQSLIGSHLPPLNVLDHDGVAVEVNYGDAVSGTVLYIFRPYCTWCAQNVALINAVSEQAGDRFRFIGVSLTAEGLKEYLSETNQRLPETFHSPAKSVISSYKLGLTPQTLLIAPDGQVLEQWTGAYLSENRSKIEQVMGVSIPKISADLVCTECSPQE